MPTKKKMLKKFKVPQAASILQHARTILKKVIKMLITRTTKTRDKNLLPASPKKKAKYNQNHKQIKRLSCPVSGFDSFEVSREL